MSRSRPKILSFTLIELLIVIVIIGILATALITKVKNIQAKSRDTARIAHMRQMQQAMELYYNDYGKYPGASVHYVNNLGTGCSHQATPQPWTGAFTSTFTANYLPTLPVDPLGNNPEYCYGYTFVQGNSNSVHFCTKKDGTIIDIDGMNSNGDITGPIGMYVLTFIGETDLSDRYPVRNRWNGYGNAKYKRYCVFPSGF